MPLHQKPPASFQSKATLLIMLCAAILALNMHTAQYGMRRPRSVRRLPKAPELAQAVLLLHCSGSPERWAAASGTWFRSAGPDLALFPFGSCPGRAEEPAAPSAFHKTRRALLAARDAHPRAEVFAKFDDDAYVYTRALLRAARRGNDTVAYAGYPMRGEGGLLFGSGGAGYVLSRASVGLLEGCETPHERYEDLAVGHCLGLAGVELTDLEGLHPHHPLQMILWDKTQPPGDRVRKEAEAGYLNPLSYHYVPPQDMLRMHDDAHLHGFPERRTSPVPRILHQFWEGSGNRPEFLLQKCKSLHADGWEHRVWDGAAIRRLFPSGYSDTQPPSYDGEGGRLLNHEFYADPPHLRADLFRYEALLLFGGMYVDADSECLRPLDHFFADFEAGDEQGFGFLEKDESYVDGLQANGVIAMRPFCPLAVLLVRNVHLADFGLPPWQSVGPLYYTQAVKKAKAAVREGRAPAYFDVAVYPSRHVYPYHHSDARGEDAREVLRAKGSVMDQKWGTTSDSYGRHARAWPDPPPLPEGLGGLPAPLREYTLSHRRGLTPAGLQRPRWLVAELHPNAGMCNRIMHVLSCLAMAMATDRVLLFDWTADAAHMHENGAEEMAQSDFADVFAEPWVRHSYAEAARRAGAAHEAESVTITHDNTQFLEDLRHSDVDKEYPQSVVRVARYDWWAPPLFLNPMYQPSVFRGNGSEAWFSELFRYLFRPREPPERRRCTWLLQYRAVWERATAPFEKFLDCAEAHGMAPGDASAWVTTDDRARASSERARGLQYAAQGCRRGAECDLRAIQAAYALSECGGAVLTATSTFGACIAGLGRIRDLYKVGESGQCARQARSDPVDAGVLPGQEAQVSAAEAHQRKTGEHLRGAFAFLLLGRQTDEAIGQLIRTLSLLGRHFNDARRYSAVVFTTEGRASLEFLQQHASFRVLLAEASGDPFLSEHLARFDYVVALGQDAVPDGAWERDPFAEMSARGSKAGYYAEREGADNATAALRKYARARGLRPRRLFHECLVGFSPAALRTREYRELSEHLGAGQQALAAYAALYLEDAEVEHFGYLSVQHRGESPRPDEQHAACLRVEEDKREVDRYHASGGDKQYQWQLDYLQRGAVVFDVGGNMGMFVRSAAGRGFSVHVFEPVREFYDFLASAYSQPDVHTHHYGLGKESGTASVLIGGAQGEATSQYITGEGRTEQIQIKTLEEAMRDSSAQAVDLLNINCEGCEFDLLEHATSTGAAAKLARIQVQFHPKTVERGTARRCEIRRRLRQTHREEYNFPWIWERWARKD